MKTNLFINFYVDSSKERQSEIEICIKSNINNQSIDRIIVLLSDNHLIELNDVTCNLDIPNQLKIKTILFEGRPTYNDYFKLTENYPSDINIIANSDMVMDYNSIMRLKSWSWKNYCLALSRWDFVNKDLCFKDAIHFNRADSQDVWILKGAFPQIEGVDFGLGIGGCDNRIALLLSKYYELINPSLDIITYHYHLSKVRNWIKNGITLKKVAPPYKLITPTYLPI